MWVEAVMAVTFGAWPELVVDDVVVDVAGVAAVGGVEEACHHRRDTSFAQGVRWVD
jgi:hypothetical protein